MAFLTRAGPNEERYALAEAFTPHVYAMPYIFRLEGILDPDRLDHALRLICESQPALRTGFKVASDGSVDKYVVPARCTRFQHIHLPDASLEDVRSKLHPRFFTKPNLTPDELSKFFIVRTSEQLHYLAFAHHHSISDGVSLRLFTEQLFDLYAASDFAPGDIALQPAPTWNWIGTEQYTDSLAYWRHKLDGVESDMPVPEDVTPREVAGQPACTRIELDGELSQLSQERADELGVSRFTLFYGACIVALSRLLGKQQIATAFQSDGRRGVENAEHAIGAFSNSLINATVVDETLPACDFLKALRSDIRDALKHSACPYHHVIRESGVHPRFGINWYPPSPALEVPGLTVSPADMLDRQSDYDFNFRFVEEGNRISLLVYHAPGISTARASAVAETALELARAIVRNPDLPLCARPSRTFATAGILPAWEQALPVALAEPIHQQFVRRAADAPDSLALIHRNGTFTYAEVNVRANAIAQRLVDDSHPRGSVILIIGDRAPWLIWSMLGIAKAGCTFVVLDSAYPSQRIALLADVCAPDAIVCHPDGDGYAVAVELAAARGIPSIGADLLAGESSPETSVATDPDQPAYLLFTSGSTGMPKCVACSHRPLSNFINWQQRTFDLKSTDRFTMLSGLSHDPLLRDIFTPLSAGASILIPDQEDIYEPSQLARWFAEMQPTATHMTPPMAQLLIAGKRTHGKLTSLTHVFMGGDAFRTSLATSLCQAAPNAKIINFYGSTETPQAASWYGWDGEVEHLVLPIGRGSDGFQVGVLDDRAAIKGIGEIGDIAVRSELLSMGYMVDGKLEKPNDRLSDALGRSTIYRTGDRGYFGPDGNVAIVGRQDDQLKIRGYRVDLTEITSALLALSDVSSGIAVAVGTGDVLSIRAFVAGPGADKGQSLLAELATKLPGYMLPDNVVVVDQLPLLPNGKVDRQLLASMVLPDVATGATLNTPGEQQIGDAWANILSRKVTSSEQSFATMGGDSLSYVQAYLATEEILGRLPDGWQFMPIRELAQISTAERSAWVWIDTGMLIRALSITTVVAAHFRLIFYSGGATSALFLISGFMFGGFQLTEAIANHTGRPILRLFAKVLVPTAIVSWGLYASKVYQGKLSDVSTAFFYSNLVSPYEVGDDFYLWYVHCALQILLLMWVAVKIRPALPEWSKDRFNFSTAIFGVAALIKFTVPAFFIPDFYRGVIIDHAIANYATSTHLPTFALGAMIASAGSRQEKMVTLAVTWAYCALTFAFFYSYSWAVMAAAAPILLFLPRVMVWRPLRWPIFALSGASLFIYLTHIKYFWIYNVVGLPAWAPLRTALALAGGIITWLIWQRIWAFGLRLKRSSSDRHPEDALAAA